jgi:transaldolase
MVDEQLEAKIRAGMDPARLRPLLGKAAVANTVMVYQEFKQVFFAQRFEGLRARGAHLQRPLWGSTSTKNPAYPDLLYVEPLVGPHTVNTVPPQTYAAILDHARPSLTIDKGLADAEQTLRSLAGAGIEMAAVLRKLEDDGVAAFMKSFEGLSRNICEKRKAMRASL